MFEKVNPCHPDKVADRIAGAIVDLAYKRKKNPKVACEVLIGHNECHIIIESDLIFTKEDITPIVKRIVGKGIKLTLKSVLQDTHLAENQSKEIRCGDNGIFKGVPISQEQKDLTNIAKEIYFNVPYDGKYILDDFNSRLVICQSNISKRKLFERYIEDKVSYKNIIINPIGDWLGGINVDSGATNRKLGSDMGDSITGGGLHGKDLSKADVSVNIFAFLLAQKLDQPILLNCAIGDKKVGGYSYKEIVKTAREYIKSIGGFEKFAEWGLIR